MRALPILLSFLALVSVANSQNWALSGKVVDAEEGNGLGSVTVALAKAGMQVVTAKNGDWSITNGTGIRQAYARTRADSKSYLHLENGRLVVRMDGIDIMGRGDRDWKAPEMQAFAGRATDAVQDTLVYTREGYVVKRTPINSSTMTALRDSIRRIRYAGWVDSSHSNGFKPDTTDAFMDDTLRKITFKFPKADWDKMMKAMADSCGAFGKSGGFMGGTSKNCQDGQYDLIENTALIWVKADLLTDGQVWKNVGIRLKGNASLQSSWAAGRYSLPFRIATDTWEDSFPTVKNQRFHGFKKFSFFNSEQDTSGIRGPVAGEIFRQMGIPTPMSVPVQLLLDRGDGSPLNVGIYEMVEIPDNPLLTRNFSNDSGNLYKPLSKLNQYVDSEWVDDDIKGDYSDVKELIAAINDATRSSNPTAWKAKLEKVLDVDGFLKWLATSTAIMNWDAYGNLAHNYYLFNDKGRFRWITYDFGWSFDYQMATAGIVSRTSIWYDAQAGGMMNLGPFPLVKNALADKAYCEAYRKYITAAIANSGPAGDENFERKVDKYGKLVSSQTSTQAPVAKLRGFMEGRIPEIQSSLSAKTCPIQ